MIHAHWMKADIMYYVHFTINVGPREYDVTLPKVKSFDATVRFFQEQYPEATSMVLSIVFEPNPEAD